MVGPLYGTSKASSTLQETKLRGGEGAGSLANEQGGSVSFPACPPSAHLKPEGGWPSAFRVMSGKTLLGHLPQEL